MPPMTTPPSLHPAIPTPPSSARQLLEAVSPDARADSAANALAKTFGVDVVRAALKDPEWQPDQRTSAQKQHDEMFGHQPLADTNAYRTPLPTTVTSSDPADYAAFDTMARELVTDCGFPPEAGRGFIQQAVRATADLNSASDKAALLDRWQSDLSKLHTPEVIEAASKQILDMLQIVGANDLVEQFKTSGLFRHPALFNALKSRAAAFHMWRDSRPGD